MKNLLFVAVSLFLVSCNQPNQEKTLVSENISNTVLSQNSEAYNLLKTQCYVCHSITSVSHDSIMAPPMAAVKMRYSKSYSNKEDFIKAVAEWTENPTKENALMRGAVNQFDVMPKLILKPGDIEMIANYIYDNELEEPEWFDAHQQEMHGNGIGQGKGMGRRNRMN